MNESMKGWAWFFSTAVSTRIFARVLIFACLVGSVCVAAAEPVASEGAATSPATSILVFNYPPDTLSLNRTDFPMIHLADVPGNNKSMLRLGRKTGLQTMEVPAGTYYVQQVISGHSSLQRAPRPVPDSDKEMLQIPPGVIAYLGDVRWSSDIGLQMSFSREGLLDIQKKNDLQSKSLYLVAFGMEPRSVSWE